MSTNVKTKINKPIDVANATGFFPSSFFSSGLRIFNEVEDVKELWGRSKNAASYSCCLDESQLASCVHV